MNVAPENTEETILIRNDEDGVATLTLNRPKARNALSIAMLDALQTELDAIAVDKSVKAVVIAGNGPVFCAGHDLKEIRANSGSQAFEALMQQCSAMMLSITRLPQPVIAKVHATAAAAGCQLVASCDLAVAASHATFVTPGVNIGLFCSTPMVALSRIVGRKQAMEMLLTGQPITAERAMAFGLVNRVVEAEALDETVDEFTALMASKSPLTVAMGKEAFYRQIELGVEDAYAYATKVMVRNMMARDAEEGIDAFIEKREPVWEGR